MDVPFLVGANVDLRALALEDLQGPYVSWFNDAEVCAANGHHRRPFSRSEAEAFIAQAQRLEDSLVLAIVAKPDRRHVGNIQLKRIDAITRMAELAIIIGDRASWGKGYSKEAARLLLDHAFFELNLNRVYCATFETNTPMRRLAAYLAMVEEGRRREAGFKRGRFLSVIEYGVLRSEYAAKFGGASRSEAGR